MLFRGRRCVRWLRGSGGWSRLSNWRWGIGGEVEIVADGFAPGIGAEGVDVFVLGEVQGLHEGLAEIREGGGGFGLHLTLGDSGERSLERLVDMEVSRKKD